MATTGSSRSSPTCWPAPCVPRCCLVYAYRDRQACAALRSVADQRGSIARLPLGPMTEAECGQFVGAVTPSRLRVLYCDSHGIPLYLRARLRALAGGSAVEQAALLDRTGLALTQRAPDDLGRGRARR